MTKQLRKQIEKTINVLETEGWCQGDLSKKIHGQEHYCLIGAYRKANPRLAFSDTEDLFRETFREKFSESPVEFNDKPHQKKSRVIGALRKLIQD